MVASLIASLVAVVAAFISQIDASALLVLLTLLPLVLGSVAGTTANSVNLLKRLWGNDVPTPMYKASKLLAMVKKDSTFGSEGRYVVVSVAPPGGGSSDFAEAVAAQRNTSEVRFFVTRKREYQVWSLDNEAIHATRGDKNALVELVRHYLNRARYAYARASAKRVWGDRGGTIGRIIATQSLTTNVVTLRSRTDISGFEVGMQIQFASADGTASGASSADLRDGGKRGLVSAVNRNGTTTTIKLVDPATGAVMNLNSWAAITVNDFIVRAGDYANAKTGARGWAPSANPTGGESFFGVDRTLIDMQRVSGARHAGGGITKTETLINACAEGQLVGVGAETSNDFTCFVDPLSYRDIAKDRESVRTADVEVTGTKIGFKALTLATSLGDITVVSETDAPLNEFRIMDPGEIYSRCAGDDPMDLVGMNGGLLVYQNEDKRQGRLGSYGNYFWENPGNGVYGTF